MPKFVNQADHKHLINMRLGIEKGLSMEGLLCVILNKRLHIKELGLIDVCNGFNDF